jgi:hypothetical protein
MSTRRNVVSSGTEFESAVGYSRGVRIDPHVVVSGTTGSGPAEDTSAQTREALRRVGIALNEGRGADHVRAVDGSRSRRLFAGRREAAVSGRSVAGDTNHSVDGQRSVQMREQHRFRIR